MALCRCEENHSNQPIGRKKEYVKQVQPIGYPNTSSICGRAGCEYPGLIWLTKEESCLYDNDGIRIFSYDTNVCKVKVK